MLGEGSKGGSVEEGRGKDGGKKKKLMFGLKGLSRMEMTFDLLKFSFLLFKNNNKNSPFFL